MRSADAVRCSGQSLHRIHRARTEWRRCGRYTTDPSGRCWQHRETHTNHTEPKEQA